MAPLVSISFVINNINRETYEILFPLILRTEWQNSCLRDITLIVDMRKIAETKIIGAIHTTKLQHIEFEVINSEAFTRFCDD